MKPQPDDIAICKNCGLEITYIPWNEVVGGGDYWIHQNTCISCTSTDATPKKGTIRKAGEK